MMWEMLLEFDYLTFRNCISVGYLLALSLPFVAVYILYKGNILSNKKNHQISNTLQKSQYSTAFRCSDRRVVQRYFIYIRRKEAPDDSEEPASNCLFVFI